MSLGLSSISHPVSCIPADYHQHIWDVCLPSIFLNASSSLQFLLANPNTSSFYSPQSPWEESVLVFTAFLDSKLTSAPCCWWDCLNKGPVTKLNGQLLALPSPAPFAAWPVTFWLWETGFHSTTLSWFPSYHSHGSFAIFLAQNFSTSVILTFWVDNSLLWGSDLCFVGCLAASLTSTHEVSVATTVSPLHPHCNN